jgi:hypothetical protein
MAPLSAARARSPTLGLLGLVGGPLSALLFRALRTAALSPTFDVLRLVVRQPAGLLLFLG